MKKIVSLGLCLLLVASLTACGSSKAAAYKAGTYKGVSKGHNGDITVEVVLDETSIKDIKVTTHAEIPGISDAALKDIPAAIVKNQSLKVDAISGATVTSKGVIAAVDSALVSSGITDTSKLYK